MELLDYDPGTGVFRWKVSRGTVHAGAVAGSINDSEYRTIMIAGRNYRASRLAWLIVKGEWPPHMIDHKNRKRSDDRFENLRPATRQQNSMNQSAKPSMSGLKGAHHVRWRKGIGYQARIKSDGKVHYLGFFRTAIEAHKKYCEEAKRLFGEFARCA